MTFFFIAINSYSINFFFCLLDKNILIKNLLNLNQTSTMLA